MTSEELVILVNKVVHRKYESQTIELKKAKGGAPTKLYDTLSSFSNQDGGGIILFGIDEKSGYTITGINNVQLLQQKITEQCAQMQPKVRPVFSYADIDGKTVVSAEIGSCDINEKPCYYVGKGKSGGAYVRIGDADTPMSDYEIYSYEVLKRKIKDEVRVIEGADVDELDSHKIDEYLDKIKEKKPNLAKLSLKEILKFQNIVTTAPTLIGLLLFGKYPQTRLPQLGIIASVVAGEKMGEMTEDGVRFNDDKRIEGTIPEMLEGALDFIKKNMRNRVAFDKDSKRIDRTEYPLIAIREAILNALVHRDYSIYTENTPIQILMFSDRIEISNPGGLYGRTTLDQLGKCAVDVRNPSLASALEIMISSENRYSGIPTIRAEMKKYGLKEPEFKSNRNEFRAIFYDTPADDDNIERQIIQFCSVPRSRDEIAHKFNVSSVTYFIRRYIMPLVEKGRIKETIPEKPRSKNQKYYAAY